MGNGEMGAYSAFLRHLRCSAGDGEQVTGDGFKRCAARHCVVIGAARLAAGGGIKHVRRVATPAAHHSSPITYHCSQKFHLSLDAVFPFFAHAFRGKYAEEGAEGEEADEDFRFIFRFVMKGHQVAVVSEIFRFFLQIGEGEHCAGKGVAFVGDFDGDGLRFRRKGRFFGRDVRHVGLQDARGKERCNVMIFQKTEAEDVVFSGVFEGNQAACVRFHLSAFAALIGNTDFFLLAHGAKKRAEAGAIVLVRKGIAVGVSIVVDDIFIRPKWRDARKCFAECGAGFLGKKERDARIGQARCEESALRVGEKCRRCVRKNAFAAGKKRPFSAIRVEFFKRKREICLAETVFADERGKVAGGNGCLGGFDEKFSDDAPIGAVDFMKYHNGDLSGEMGWGMGAGGFSATVAVLGR